MNRPCPTSFRSALLAACTVLGLVACGGGGSSGSSSTAVGSGSGSGGTASTAAQAIKLTGVVALGAPLAGAQVRVMDANGTLVGAATTRSADGGYSLTTASANAPLLVQVSGVNAAGLPVLMHSALPADAATGVVNVTPLSEALLALALGTEPRVAFADAKPATLKTLASLSAASDFLKTLVKAPLADAKVGDSKKLDLLGDAGFAANKTGVDLALEALALGYGTDANGKLLLTVGNKLANTPREVLVDLATAATELAKTTAATTAIPITPSTTTTPATPATPGTPAIAVTSTLTSSTSPTAQMATLAALDDLAAALNKVIAESAGLDATAAAAKVQAAGLLGSYTQHDGQTADQLAVRIGDWASRRMQVGRLQVVGCADDPIVKTGCSRVLVVARLNDSAGEQADALEDAVTYTAKPSAKWALAGNGFATTLDVRSTAWLALGADGQALGDMPTPGLGVQVRVGSSAASATVQTPSGYVLPMLRCDRPTLCVANDGSSTATAAKGGLADNTVLRGVNAWLGTADLATGARYRATVAASDGSSVARSAQLRAAFSANPALSLFPVLDSVSASQLVSGSSLLAGGTLNWASWAARRADLRITALRLVLVDSNGAAQVTDVLPSPWPATSAVLPASEATDVAGITLWLTAVDAAGRTLHTSYKVL